MTKKPVNKIKTKLTIDDFVNDLNKLWEKYIESDLTFIFSALKAPGSKLRKYCYNGKVGDLLFLLDDLTTNIIEDEKKDVKLSSKKR